MHQSKYNYFQWVHPLQEFLEFLELFSNNYSVAEDGVSNLYYTHMPMSISLPSPSESAQDDDWNVCEMSKLSMSSRLNWESKLPNGNILYT